MKVVTKNISKKISLYIHIPFCKYKCYFCSFATITGKRELINEYVYKLFDEINLRLNQLKNDVVIESIYFGGGTPNSLETNQLEMILLTINNHVDLSTVREISMEVAPNQVTSEYMQQLKKLGINRVTIGLQTFDDNIRKLTGRLHTTDDFMETFKHARNADIDSVGVDLIIGLGNQNLETMKSDIHRLVDLAPDHISTYVLAIEDGTVLDKIKNKVNFPKDKDTAVMYNYVCNYLSKNNFEQYEISNWCKTDHECIYNLNTWNYGEYIGFGISASSHFDGKRWTNTRDIKEYLSAKIFDRIENRSEKEREFEKLLLGLRLVKGFELTTIQDKKLVELVVRNVNIIKKGQKARIHPSQKVFYDSIIQDIYNKYML